MCKTFLLLLLAAAAHADSDEDIILPPVVNNSSLPERLLIFMPGADVPNTNYKLTMQAIQKASTEIRLYVLIPATFQRKCIIQCATPSLCFVLKHYLAESVAKVNFPGKNPKEDTFVAGHSMGSICANYIVASSNFEYAGLLAFGGYVDETGDTSLTNYSVPVVHMSGELDGGAARPGKLALWYKQYQGFADKQGQELALTRKPVQVLPGMDHSDFCPGFFVTAIKDLPSEVTQDVAMETIGTGAAAFLHLNTGPVPAAAKSAAMAKMQSMLQFTESIFNPVLQAEAMEQSGDKGPWCERAQHLIVGLGAADDKKLEPYTEVRPIGTFEHGHTNYTHLPGGGLKVKVISTAEASGGFGPFDTHGAAKSVDCKMLDATRVQQQLNATTNASIDCGSINKVAVDVALNLLPSHSRQRYEAQPRRYCFAPDTPTFGNIGPLFVKGSLKMTETAPCMEVSSLSLVSTIESKIFPGNHYCKLLSPAMAMEWMMTDGLKPFPWHPPTSRSSSTASVEDLIV